MYSVIAGQIGVGLVEKKLKIQIQNIIKRRKNMIYQQPTLKAIHIAKSLEKPTARAKLGKEHVFANALRGRVFLQTLDIS